MRVAVIGSGPAAMACTAALLRRGLAVTVIDAGERLQPELQAVVDRMGAQPPESWSAGDIARITRNPTVENRHVPTRLAFGSDFVYGLERPGLPLERHEVTAAPTYARGGYSVVWGGAMLPVHDDDIEDWPLRRADLEPGYRAVLAAMPFAARRDGLSDDFPLFTEPREALRLPRQAEALLADLERTRMGTPDRLLFGQSRLAVRAAGNGGGEGCVYCGLCLSGCVRHAIHDVAERLETWIRDGTVDYRGGLVVYGIEEDAADGATVRWRGGGERFDAVFLAAGAINSARILLASRQLYDTVVPLAHSPKFVLPLLRRRATPIEWPAINSLASMFLELRLAGISRHWLHAQLSTMNDLALAGAGALRDGVWTWRGRLLGPLLRRAMIAWCGLHSAEALPITLRLRPPAADAPSVLELRARPDPRLSATIRRAAWRMARLGLGFDALFLAPLRIAGRAGDGNHVAGSLPMRQAPAALHETDLLGRPAGWHRVHVVDAAVLPSVPATTLALTIMANAWRIAEAAPLTARSARRT